jgi:hypothetical protein
MAKKPVETQSGARLPMDADGTVKAIEFGAYGTLAAGGLAAIAHGALAADRCCSFHGRDCRVRMGLCVRQAQERGGQEGIERTR